MSKRVRHFLDMALDTFQPRLTPDESISGLDVDLDWKRVCLIKNVGFINPPTSNTLGKEISLDTSNPQPALLTHSKLPLASHLLMTARLQGDEIRQ